MRKPDSVSIGKSYNTFLIGWDTQYYGYEARCFSIFIGPLVMRWHTR